MKIDLLQTHYHSLALSYSYHKDIVAFCRIIKESWGFQAFAFDVTHKAWVFSDPKIAQAIMEGYPETVITPGAKEALSGLLTLQEEESVTAAYVADLKKRMDTDFRVEGLKLELRDFQNVGVEFLHASGGRAILADDPGLGKSAQFIGLVQSEKIERTIMIAPATMKYVWESEVAKWSDLSTVVIDSDTDIASIDKSTRFWIINYDILKKHAPELLKIKFGLMGLDEAHYIKTPGTLRTKAVKTLAKGCEKIVMLTGTPVLNRPVELYVPLSLLDPRAWGSYYQFVHRYCAAHRTRFGLDVSGSSNLEELKTKMSRYFLRRTKEEVMKELPEKVRMEIPLFLSGTVATEYHKALTNFARFLRENKGKKDKEVAKALQAEKLTQLNFLRELAVKGKIQAAIEIIENVVASGQKILVFCSFNFPLEQLQEKLGTSAVLITGKTDSKERFEIVNSFQNDPGVKVFLGGIKAAGVGITLTKASNVLFLDYAWTPADHKQAEDRAHRIGNVHNSVTIYTIHARETIDDNMVNMLLKKKHLVDAIMDENSVEVEAQQRSGMSEVLAQIEASALGEIY